MNKIYYNAIRFAQRSTGAFGCDTCLTDHQRELHPIGYDVYWCCTMRGGEFVFALTDNLYKLRDNTLEVLTSHNTSVSLENSTVKTVGDYPFGDTLRFEVAHDER